MIRWSRTSSDNEKTVERDFSMPVYLSGVNNSEPDTSTSNISPDDSTREKVATGLPQRSTKIKRLTPSSHICNHGIRGVCDDFWLPGAKKNMLFNVSFMEAAICNPSCVCVQVKVFILLLLMNMHELSYA